MCTSSLDPPGTSAHDTADPRLRTTAVRIADGVLTTVALYAFAGWAYIALNAVVHPDSLRLPLTHFADWPREDTFGVACFITSFGSALGLRILRALS